MLFLPLLTRALTLNIYTYTHTHTHTGGGGIGIGSIKTEELQASIAEASQKAFSLFSSGIAVLGEQVAKVSVTR